MPNPEAVPADPRAAEPLVELGTIEIPKIGVVKSMFEGITLTTLDHGPGHWPGTAMPGQLGNVVIAGHRVSHDKPFRHLDQLGSGDDVILTTADGRFVYKVTGTEIVVSRRVVDRRPDTRLHGHAVRVSPARLDEAAHRRAPRVCAARGNRPRRISATIVAR